MSSGIGAAAEVLINLYMNDHRPKTQATSPDLVRMRTPQPSPTDTSSDLPERMAWPTQGPLFVDGRPEKGLDQSRGLRGLHFLTDEPHSAPQGVISQGRVSLLLSRAPESSVKRPGRPAV